ncbi:MAG: DMT family transporter [Clostridia bacterium]|nr:DMT family transporter [Clostridia bacterium]
MKERNGKGAGVALVLLSAFLYGATPMLTKQTYLIGSDPLTSTLLRASLALPLLALIVVLKGESLLLKRHEILPMTATGLAGGVTMILLAGSYAYIPVGVATVMHFVYPVLVALLGRVWLKERLNGKKLLALVLSVSGILCFFERGGQVLDLRGVAMALCSGLTFACYVILMGRPVIRDMWYMRTAFWNAVFGVVAAGGYGLVTHGIRTDFDPRCYLYMLAVSVLTMGVAVPALKVGVRRIGSLPASVLSTLEPISSVILSAIFLGETISPMRLLGCVLVIASVVVIALAETKRSE